MCRVLVWLVVSCCTWRAPLVDKGIKWLVLLGNTQQVAVVSQAILNAGDPVTCPACQACTAVQEVLLYMWV